jgi:hypothetical protein
VVTAIVPVGPALVYASRLSGSSGEVAESTVEGEHLFFTGSGPFPQEQLEEWVEKLGAFARPDTIDLGKFDWIVIGREGYDVETLLDSFNWPYVRYFSQEGFLRLLLFGEESRGDAFTGQVSAPHPGLELVGFCDPFEGERYLDEVIDPSEEGIEPASACESHPPPEQPPVEPTDQPAESVIWPVISGDTGDEPFDDTGELQLESDLAKLGYSVAKHIGLARRQASLERCVETLGLQRVIRHLAWLIRFHNKNLSQQNAIQNWQHDLEWLKSHHGTR